MSKVKEQNKKFNLINFKIAIDENGNEYIEPTLNKSLVFEDEEIQGEFTRIIELFIKDISELILD